MGNHDIEIHTTDSASVTKLRATTRTDPDNTLAGAIRQWNTVWHLWSNQVGSPIADITCNSEADARAWVLWFAEQTLNAR